MSQLLRRPVWILLLLGAPIVGCDPRDVKPRGAGASGRGLSVLKEPDIDIERFFKYTPEQQTVLNLMNKPHDAVARPGPAAGDPNVARATKKVADVWSELKYQLPAKGSFIRYRVNIQTNAGDLVIDFFEGFSPDVVRNVVARFKTGAYDGRPVTLETDALIIGSPADKQPYTLPSRPIPTPLPKGAFYAVLVDDRAAGDRFGIALRRIVDGGSKVSMCGRVANANLDESLGQFVKQLLQKPDSITIKSSRIDEFMQPIFQGPEVMLPRLTKDGELEIPDLAMYTGVSAMQMGKGQSKPMPGARTERTPPGSNQKSAPQSPTIPPAKESPPSKGAKDAPKPP